MRSPILFVLISACAVLRSAAQTTNADRVVPDPYIPKLRTIETNAFIGKPAAAYRFTEGQLARMARTKLETNRLVAYLDQKWPVERLKAHCSKTNTFPNGFQNLVTIKCPIETDLHKGKATGFDRVWVYVSEDDGHGTYIEEAGSGWHRWTYSINVTRGKRHWVIIEQLPNDFVDSSRYDPKQSNAAEHLSSPRGQ
jgi:hypothetical protein